ncbi:MAG: DUF1499 domain-containing protein [Paracoccaceae bacterium]|nr:DUF1499 domain-containing protein [Paracoccaceae bacterium]
MIGTLLVVLIVAFMSYVRFSPLPAERWHQSIAAASDTDFAGGAVRVLPGNAALFARMDQVMTSFPRTRILAGSRQDGHITYVTRSAVFGFPDITTIELQGDDIKLYARLRFGASDLGVNRKRLERLIAGAKGG